MRNPPSRRVADDLRRRITAGEWAPGERIPSRGQLQQEYGVGPGAAQRAVDILREEGIAVGRPRTGVVVADPVPVRTLTDPDIPWPYGRGERTLDPIAASPELAIHFAIDPGAPVLRERIDMLDPDGRPSHVAVRWTLDGTRRPWAEQRREVSGRPAARDEAVLLGTAAGAHVLVCMAVRWDRGGRVVEVVELVLPADRWRIAL
ncbi:UTRA domain-containing protein [Peterkaempfera sp. SMS 1(5)a]|uniref:UTRA domain-containing protein n=1 Tax=Peterkaempfera podocarpi TaxID=3232308 RepID=UPI00366D92A2